MENKTSQTTVLKVNSGKLGDFLPLRWKKVSVTPFGMDFMSYFWGISWFDSLINITSCLKLVLLYQNVKTWSTNMTMNFHPHVICQSLSERLWLFISILSGCQVCVNDQVLLIFKSCRVHNVLQDSNDPITDPICNGNQKYNPKFGRINQKARNIYVIKTLDY